MNEKKIARKLWLRWGFAAALPIALALFIRSQMSWRPRVITMKNAVRSVAISPRGDLWAAGEDAGLISLWNVDSGKIVLKIQNSGFGAVSILVFSPDGRSLVSGGPESEMSLWDVGKGNAKINFGKKSQFADSIAFATDGKSALSSGGFGTVKLWDVRTGTALHFPYVGGMAYMRCVAFSPDGKLWGVGIGEHAGIWKIDSGYRLCDLIHTGFVTSIAFSPNGKLLASGSKDKTVRIWNVSARKLGRTLTGHNGAVNSITFSPDGTLLASCSDDKTIKLWDVKLGKMLRTMEGHSSAVNAIAFTKDGNTLISGSVDKTVRLWRIK